ncbi:hypothetical protein EV644_107287 [Kribbella orskensis]|uniref:Transposase of IS4/5 family DUF4096 n=1 Tax=Kribbella orskensis TaxID=2512216 RepID=A0ABY2BJ59_9ACTN|nr:hypothetical protein EV642_107287 [Kribbella sp. VKM Ac-2500]TCO21962.1 hypothetical protein EV644_107287 [Kribbella orskensis]
MHSNGVWQTSMQQTQCLIWLLADLISTPRRPSYG